MSFGRSPSRTVPGVRGCGRCALTRPQKLSWQVPGDDVENSESAPSQGAPRPAPKENTMAKYLLLKHYRGAPAPVNAVPMDRWRPDEVEAHIRFMNDFAARLESSGEFVDGQALSPDGVWVR